MKPILITKRMILRPLAANDAPDIVRLLNEREIADRLSRVPHPYLPEHAEQWIRNNEDNSDEFSLTLDRNGFMGAIGLRHLKEDTPEIGYWLGKPYWGFGYMTEAAYALLAHAFDLLGYERIRSGYFDTNRASARVLEKLGFTITGKDMRHSLAQGKELAHTNVHLTREQFEKIAP